MGQAGIAGLGAEQTVPGPWVGSPSSGLSQEEQRLEPRGGKVGGDKGVVAADWGPYSEDKKSSVTPVYPSR